MRERFLASWEVSIAEAFRHAVHHHWPSWAVAWIIGSFFGWIAYSRLAGYYAMVDLLLIVITLGLLIIIDALCVFLWYKASPGVVRVGLTNIGIHLAIHGKWLSQSPLFIPWIKVEQATLDPEERVLLVKHHARWLPATIAITVPRHAWRECQKVVKSFA